MANQQPTRGARNAASTPRSPRGETPAAGQPDAFSALSGMNFKSKPKRTAQEVLDVGKHLLVLKEATPHGDFLPRLKEIGISTDVGARFMDAARRFSDPKLSSLVTAAGTQSKLFELLPMDDETLADLAAGKSVAGLDLDRLASLSVSQLRTHMGEAQKAVAAALARTRESALARVTKAPSPIPPGASPLIGGGDGKCLVNEAFAAGNPTGEGAGGDPDPAAGAIPTETAAEGMTALYEAFRAERNQFSDIADRLCTRTHRVRTVLRLLRRNFNLPPREQIDANDVHEMVAMLEEITPHQYEDVADPLQDFEFKAGAAVKKAHSHAENLGLVLAAVTSIAHGNVPLAVAQAAVEKVCDVAHKDAAFWPHFYSLVEALESHGFHVNLMEHNGVPVMPRVGTEAMRQAERRVSRKIKDLILATEEVGAWAAGAGA